MNRIKARLWRKRWLLCVKLIAFSVTLLATSNCTTNMTGTEASFCSLYYPVYYDSLVDSPETISSININNALYEQCPF